jgi:hypothetical protein
LCWTSHAHTKEEQNPFSPGKAALRAHITSSALK